MLRRWREYYLIKRSGLFDPAYYLLNNPDVRQADVDPLMHFVTHGWKEGRNPSNKFDTKYYLKTNPDVKEAEINPLVHYIRSGKTKEQFSLKRKINPTIKFLRLINKVNIAKAINVIKIYGMRVFFTKVKLLISSAKEKGGDFNFDKKRIDYREWVHRYDTLSDQERSIMRERIESFTYKPLISVIMPCYNPKLKWLKEAIESVRGQIYPFWQLCIADDRSTNPAIRKALEQYNHEDPRIKVIFRDNNGNISVASNSALNLATGKYIALLDHDDQISEHALFWVVECINRNPDARLIFSDEDKITATGKRADPYFKCEFNYDLFLSQNMINHLGVYQTALVRQLGGFRKGLEGAQDWDLAFRCIEELDQRQIVHIPRVLYHWRVHANSVALNQRAKPYALSSGKRAVQEHLERSKLKASVESLPDIDYLRVQYLLPKPEPLVTLIIPTHNGLPLLRQCVSSILNKTEYPNFEILILDNASNEPEVLFYLDSLSKKPQICILRDDRPFNFSALNNHAAQVAGGKLLGLINNDTEVINSNWLSEMVSIAIQPRVGAVGARLWYPNDTLQHGGIILGVGGVAGHSHKGLPKGSPGYFSRASLQQSVSAITAACLVIQRSIFLEIGGLDEQNLSIAFNDVDFCLRVREAGYRNIWTPYAEFYHHESASRGYEDTYEKQNRFREEVQYMKQRWGNLLLEDPAYSPNLTLDYEDFSYAWPPRINYSVKEIEHKQSELPQIKSNHKGER